MYFINDFFYFVKKYVKTTNNTNKVLQIHTAIFVFSLAFLISRRLLGRTPAKIKVLIPARLRQTIFAKNNKNALNAGNRIPAPKSNPVKVKGGNNETATITPTNPESLCSKRYKIAETHDTNDKTIIYNEINT